MEGEKDIMVSHLASFIYVEDEGQIHKTPFQAFEVVRVVMVPPAKETKNDEFPMVSWKDARIVIEVGHLEGWGRVLELPVNKDHSSLGYHSQQSTLRKSMKKAIEGHVLPLLDIFTSVGHLVDGQISMVEEDIVVDTVGLMY